MPPPSGTPVAALGAPPPGPNPPVGPALASKEVPAYRTSSTDADHAVGAARMAATPAASPAPTTAPRTRRDSRAAAMTTMAAAPAAIAIGSAHGRKLRS